MDVKLNIVHLDKAIIATPQGELDLATAPDLHEQLLRLLSERRTRLVVIALDRLAFCDAAGLRVLVHAQRRARLLDIDLRLAAPTPAMTKLFRITGLDQTFRVWPTTVAALADHVQVPRPAEAATRLSPVTDAWDSQLPGDSKVARVG